MILFDKDIRLFTRVSMQSRRILIELTDPLQVPMDEVEAVKILQSMCDIYQLRERISCRATGRCMLTHELDSVHFCVLLNEFVDVAVDHPFRHKRELVRLQCCTEQR